MSRWIELMAAILSCALGLIWIIFEVSMVQSLWIMGALNGSGAGPAPQPIGINSTGAYFAMMTCALIGVAIGAYLHSVQRFLAGNLLVWLSATLATIGIGIYQIEPWRFMPAGFIFVAQATSLSWLTPVGVLAIVCAWVAAVAGIPVRADTPSTSVIDKPAASQTSSLRRAYVLRRHSHG